MNEQSNTGGMSQSPTGSSMGGNVGESVEFRSESIEFHPDSASMQGDGSEQRGAIRRAASRLGEQARERVTSKLEEQKGRAAGTIGGVAHALLAAGEQLGSGDEARVRPYVERLGNQVDRLSNFLEQTDVEQVVDDVSQFARRHPGLFVGGAFVLGLVGARFLRSSERHRRDEHLQGEYGGLDAGYGTAAGTQRGYETGSGMGGDLGRGTVAGTGVGSTGVGSTGTGLGGATGGVQTGYAGGTGAAGGSATGYGATGTPAGTGRLGSDAGIAHEDRLGGEQNR